MGEREGGGPYQFQCHTLFVRPLLRVYQSKQWTLLKTLTGEDRLSVSVSHTAQPLEGSVRSNQSGCDLPSSPPTADHTGVVNAVRFGKNAAFLVSAGMDRTLKLFGP